MRLARSTIISRALTSLGSKVRYDGASFFGAVLCLISLFVPWMVRIWTLPLILIPRGSNLPDFMFKINWSFLDLLRDPDFTFVMALFLVGTAVSLFYRHGVALQAVGLLGFIMVAPGHFTTSVSSHSAFIVLGPGYFVALAGVLVSAFLARNFWWQRSTSGVVPSISRIAALSPNSTRISK